MAASNAIKAIGTMLRIQSKRKNKTKQSSNVNEVIKTISTNKTKIS